MSRSRAIQGRKKLGWVGQRIVGQWQGQERAKERRAGASSSILVLRVTEVAENYDYYYYCYSDYPFYHYYHYDNSYYYSHYHYYIIMIIISLYDGYYSNPIKQRQREKENRGRSMKVTIITEKPKNKVK